MGQSDEHSWDVYSSLSLKQDQFRLLKLFPASTRQAPVVIKLFRDEFSSDEIPEYDAISYRWGDPNDRRYLTANGQRISVTYSLYTALTYMRDEVSVRVLWIDGVCINQDDTVERGQQVLQMGTIYSRAQLVHIFLGEAEEGDNMAQAMDLLSTLETLDDRRRFVERVKVDQGGSRGLINLLRRPYWQRMWMFQEIVLSREAVVHCGPSKISWGSLKELDNISGDPKIWFEAQVRCDWILELRRALFDISHFFVGKDEARHFNNIIQPTRHLQCTDPRDKLFSLMGVCDTISVRADYSWPIRDVYTDFTRQILETDYDMSTLLTAGRWHPENGLQLNLPSWVPDYRGTHGVDIRYLAASHLRHFSASSLKERNITLPPRIDSVSVEHHSEGIMEPQYLLVVRGILIDTVSAIMTLKQVQDTPQSLLRLVEPTGAVPRPSGEDDYAQALFRTMIFEDRTLHKSMFSTRGYNTGNDRYIRMALGFAHCLGLSDATDKSETSFLDSFLGLKIGDRTLLQHYEHLLETDPGELQWHYREYLIRSNETSEKSASTFFVTNGNRIGKGPRDLTQGDCVAVIYGCRIPLVLRPSGQYFQLVGPCYMHGAMFGEIIDQLSGGRTSHLEESEIILV
ncbi:hypothetical protein PG984_009993 [Apiospora sp. TS-2023a]